jgi:2-polyprenyl-3-methyl-5-hydroxy-6-metoxy-1,4-benzoquinol methylase
MPISAAVYHAGKFLQEHELLPESKACPWCKFAENRARVLSLQTSPDVWLLKCPACHAVSTSRVATESAIDSYYASYYSDTAENRVTCGSPSRHARHICRYAKHPISTPRIAILDFGGGDGSISYAVAVELAKRSSVAIEIIVVDYNSSLVVSTHPRVTLSHASTLQEVPEGKVFDLVLASAILEHIPEPADITRKLLQRLAPDGYFYARTPYMAPLIQLLSRMHVAVDFTFPAHFHDLGQDFWDRILPTLDMASPEWTLVRSRPSLVETSFSDNAGRTILAHAMKAPWWLLRGSYPLLGGWEVFIHRRLAK